MLSQDPIDSLEHPMRLIAHARVGVIADKDQCRKALDIIEHTRKALRRDKTGGFDLDRAQSILTSMALGYRPDKRDCTLAVQSLACRIQMAEMGRIGLEPMSI